MKRVQWLVICYCFSLTGCVSRYPADLKLQALNLVSVNKAAFRPKATTNLTMAGDLIQLKADIVSKENIVMAAKTKGTFRVKLFLCEQPVPNEIIGSIYWDQVHLVRTSEPSLISADANGFITYSVYFDFDSNFVLGNDSQDKQHSFLAKYDFFNHPEDVCLQLENISMVVRFKSNIVRIDKDLIYKEMLKVNTLD